MGVALCVQVVPVQAITPSTDFVHRQLMPHEAGFDYAKAVREIHRHGRLTYDEIAEYCGYENKASVFKVLQGAVPDHPRGEGLYILYTELFHRKPPLKVSSGKPALTP